MDKFIILGDQNNQILVITDNPEIPKREVFKGQFYLVVEKQFTDKALIAIKDLDYKTIGYGEVDVNTLNQIVSLL